MRFLFFSGLFRDPLSLVLLIVFTAIYAGAAYGGMKVRGGKANLAQTQWVITASLLLSIVVCVFLGMLAPDTDAGRWLVLLGHVPGLAFAFGMGWWFGEPRDPLDEVPLAGHLWSPDDEKKPAKAKRKRPRAVKPRGEAERRRDA